MVVADAGRAPRSRLDPRAAILAMTAVVLATAIVVGQVRWTRHRDELLATLAEAGLESRFEGLEHTVRTEAVAHEADLAVARALVYDVLAAGREAGPDREGELRRRSARLGRAGELAQRALVAQPGSWKAAMLLGASRYLGASTARDRRLVTEAAAWEEPLRSAVRAAPGQAEPRRFLGGAYLEIWRHLSPGRKEEARALLTEAFAHDAETFQQLVGPWLAAAANPDEAFAAIPPRPEAWQAVASAYAEAHRWALFRRAWARRAETLEADFATRLAEAERRIRLGDLYYGRSILLRVVADAPAERRFAPYVESALGQYPPGLHGLASTEALGTWLDWALELGVLGRSPLAPRILGRLAGAAGDLPPAQAALAALLGGEITQAESIERQVEDLKGEPWAPYVLAKARWHLDRDELAPAAQLLDGVDRSARGGALCWLLRERLARARGDLVAREEADAALAERRLERWPATGWRWRSGRLLLTLLPARAGRGLAIALAEVPEPGAVVQILVDGEAIDTFAATAPTTVTVAAALDPSLHLLELRTVAGRQAVPGVVSLLPSSSPALPGGTG